MTALLEVNSVSKAFGDFYANTDISMKIMPGEIHALLGENGAGKSTLVKMMYGVLRPTAGEFLWNGKPIAMTGPSFARELGIGMVFQHFSLFEALTVGENVALSLPKSLAMSGVNQRVREISENYGLPLDPDRAVHSLSVGERQRIEIVRCLLQDPKLLIMDEPTSVLTPQEADRLFETLEKLASEGCSVLYISHKLDEVKRLCHTATILRHGKLVNSCDPTKETPRSLAEMMVGTKIASVSKADGIVDGAAVKFATNDLTVAAEDPLGTDLEAVTMSVKAGEILGIAGVAGNGQDELFSALSGEISANTPEAVAIGGASVGKMGINQRRKLNAAFIPEERNGHAAVGDLSLSRNSLLSTHATSSVQRRGMIDDSALESYVGDIAKRFDVRASKENAKASSLSGGNLQKFVFGREMLREPDVLIVSQPTWGVDAGAAAVIRQALLDLASKGSAIVMISQDLEEIFEVSDSIAVISEGKLSDARLATETTVEEVGLLMGGITGDGGDHVHAA